MEERIQKLENEVDKLRKRNRYVELNKSWETSTTRIISILVVTYIFVVVIMYIFKINRPFINAIVPTLGYFLSIQSLPIIKKKWLKKRTHI